MCPRVSIYLSALQCVGQLQMGAAQYISYRAPENPTCLHWQSPWGRSTQEVMVPNERDPALRHHVPSTSRSWQVLDLMHRWLSKDQQQLWPQQLSCKARVWRNQSHSWLVGRVGSQVCYLSHTFIKVNSGNRDGEDGFCCYTLEFQFKVKVGKQRERIPSLSGIPSLPLTMFLCHQVSKQKVLPTQETMGLLLLYL